MLIAIALSLLFVVGVAVAVLPPGDAPTIAMSTGDVRTLGIRFVGACVAGLLVLVVSGWVVPGVVVGAGAFWAIGGWQRRDRASGRRDRPSRRARELDRERSRRPDGR